MSKKAASADNQQERFLAHLDPHYIAGLVDGEGYFSVRANRRKQKNWILNDVRFTFGVKLRADDGIVILNALQKFFGCGFVYFRKDARNNFCNCYEFQVNTHRDIFKIIIPFFQKHPLRFPSKKKTFAQFCDIAQMIQRKEHLNVGGIEKIQEIIARMH